MNSITAGVIGLGYTGRLHLQAWQQTPGAQVIAVADSNPATAQTAPGLLCYPDYRALLETNVDAVSICLPTWLHCEATIAALNAGKHVLLEKPIAVTVAEAERMLAAARANGKTLYVGMTHRFYPELREAKQRVDNGDIGEIVQATDSIIEHFGFLDLPRWYLDKSQAGGGAVLTSGIHLVDRLRWFLNDDVTHVAGAMTNRFFHGSIEDSAQMLLRFRSGISANLTLALLPAPHPLVCDLRLLGTRGSITIHTWRGYEIHTAAGSQDRPFYTDEPHQHKVLIGMRGEVEEFCQAIRENRAPWPTAEESMRALAVVAAFYRAAQSGTMERVDA